MINLDSPVVDPTRNQWSRETFCGLHKDYPPKMEDGREDEKAKVLFVNFLKCLVKFNFLNVILIFLELLTTLLENIA